MIHSQQKQCLLRQPYCLMQVMNMKTFS